METVFGPGKNNVSLSVRPLGYYDDTHAHWGLSSRAYGLAGAGEDRDYFPIPGEGLEYLSIKWRVRILVAASRSVNRGELHPVDPRTLS